MIRYFVFGDLQGRQNASNSHRSCSWKGNVLFSDLFIYIIVPKTVSCSYLGFDPTLDVIIEGAVTVAVLIKNPESIAVGKILKLYQTVHPIPVTQSSVLIIF